MKKIILLAVILVSASLVYGTRLFEPVSTQSNTYIYPDHFPGLTLDQAIHSAEVNESDMIIVRSGTYLEHLNVNKSITLEGGLGGPTILDGGRNGTVVTIYASNVTLLDFTMQNGFDGILVQFGADNNLTNNVVRSNGEGILIVNSSNNTLRNNVMSLNGNNFGVDGTNLTDFIQDVDPSNTVDNKPIYYCVNKTGGSILPNAGYVALVNSTNVAVGNLSINRNHNGILLAYTFNSTIENNTLSQNNIGISLIASEYDEIMNNNMTDNLAGLYLNQANDNIFVYNNIEKTDPNLFSYGVSLWHSNNNTFYRNNFINNNNPVGTYQSANSFNNSREGNYWDSYSGNDTNLDGTAETPNIPYLGLDYHPLMEQWQAKKTFNVTRYGDKYYLTTLCNSTVARASVNWNQTLKRICFNITSGTLESTDVTIPRNWLDGPFEIKLNSTDVQPWRLRIDQDENNSYVSLEYDPGTYMVEIIGSRVLGYRNGDLNNDGIVDILDAIKLAGSFNRKA